MTTITHKNFVAPSLHMEFIESFLVAGDTYDTAVTNGIYLRSRYQPIYSLAHQRAVGFEALVRPFYGNGDQLLPISLFANTQDIEEKIFLDRLCRTLHVRNFVRQGDDISWLFLNVDPMVTTEGRHYGSFFKQLLDRYQLPPHRVVVEILEGKIHDENSLAEAVRYYRDIGCLVAIDDFGVGQSNFDRIWRIAPHIVKLDRSIIKQASNSNAVRRVLPSLVSLIHEAGSLVLIEGVETAEQAMIALHAEIDFVQGYFFNKPQEQLPASTACPAIAQLFEQFRENNQREVLSAQNKFSTYTERFLETISRIQQGTAIEIALADFLCIPDVRRCYLLDEYGLQIGSNYSMLATDGPTDHRFNPLNDARNAIWVRRHYFQSAVAEPDRVQISKPYLSITGGTLCVTLSIAFYQHGRLQVLCGDIDWVDM